MIKQSMFYASRFYTLDLLRGVSEVGKKSHFLPTRRLFEGVYLGYMTEKRPNVGKKGPF